MIFTRRGFLAGSGAMLWATSLSAAPSDVLQIEGPAFGAGWRVRVATQSDAHSIVAAINRVITSINDTMSPYNPASEISRFNRLESLDWIPLSPQTYATIAQAKHIAARTMGAFDPTLGGVTGRFGFGPMTQEPAGSFTDMSLGSQRAKKAHISQTLDLCGIAKGHALDQIASALRGLGHTSFFVELGGEVYAQGAHPSGRRWQAGIERPQPDSVTLQRTVVLDGEALATSGDRINSFKYGHRRYSHVIDPKHQKPTDTPLASVSVFAPKAITADALATGLFAMGPRRGVELATREHIPALFVMRGENGLQETTTADFARRIIG